MTFGGFTPFTLIDYPGKTAAMVYTIGCNFRCPYCHNYFKAEDDLVESLVMYLTDKRRYRVISWGEADQPSELYANYDWYIKLSSGLSIGHVRDVVSVFFDTFIIQPQLDDNEFIALSNKLIYSFPNRVGGLNWNILVSIFVPCRGSCSFSRVSQKEGL